MKIALLIMALGLIALCLAVLACASSAPSIQTSEQAGPNDMAESDGNRRSRRQHAYRRTNGDGNRNRHRHAETHHQQQG